MNRLVDMSPRFALLHVADCGGCNSVPLGHQDGCFPTVSTRSNLSHGVGGQLRQGMVFTKEMSRPGSSLGNAIFYVLNRCSKKQMGWVDALRVIPFWAVVAEGHAYWNGALSQGPCHALRGVVSTANAKRPIAVCLSGGPNPTGILASGAIDLRPKAIRNDLWAVSIANAFATRTASLLKTAPGASAVDYRVEVFPAKPLLAAIAPATLSDGGVMAKSETNRLATNMPDVSTRAFGNRRALAAAAFTQLGAKVVLRHFLTSITGLGVRRAGSTEPAARHFDSPNFSMVMPFPASDAARRLVA